MERWERRERKRRSLRERMPKSGYSVLLLARLAQRRAQERVRRYQQTLATLQRRRKRR
ncbi:MAG TPA: hypothetical protein VEQ11_16500 [Chloroflexota bacterium]|nr:hypothetical protein [Chloroflexota bacterium]